MRNSITQSRARSLRNHATDTERHLWRYLRDHQLGGHRFRRQVPIGNYIADFACLEAKLIIELDGGQHQEQAEYDARRDLQMETQGFRVLRFWDNEVFKETQAVLEAILRALEERTAPTPTLPRAARKGGSVSGSASQSGDCSCPHPSLPPQAGEGVSTPVGEGVSTPVGEGVSTPVGKGVSTPVGKGVSTPVGKGVSTPVGEGVSTPVGEGAILPPLHAQRAGEGWGGGTS